MSYTTINKSTDYFNTVTYTGSSGVQTISGVGHQPDFIWVKQRGDAGYDHSLHNSVSGLLKQLISNSSAAEITNTDTVTSNNADGFVLGADSAGPSANSNNQDTKTYVAWNWKANGAGSANTDGSISSTVSANTTAGFSIVKYTGTGSAGATIGHGLGAKPNVIILKNISNTQQWTSYWSPLGATKFMRFNTTDAVGTASNRWNNTEPTTSLFTVGTDGEVNQSGLNHIAYCFAEKTGYSKFGSYTGNGNDGNGVFIYTGFKPAFVIIKKSSNSGEWLILDNKRSTFNINQSKIFANDNAAENTDTSNGMDFLSNGIKLRRNNGESNEGGQSYIYMAFAEAPLVGTNNVPANAR